MTHRILLTGIVVLMPLGGFSAEETPTPAKPADADVRKTSITSLETHIAQREQRLTELGRDIVELDTRIEKRIDGLVKLIAELPESNDPSGGTNQVRKQAVEALKRGIAAYSAKRREVDENIHSGDTRAEGDLGKFDERISKRIDQIAELTKTVPAQLEDDAPDYEDSSYWNGFFFETNRLLEEGRKKQETQTSSPEAREKAAKSTKTRIETIEKRRVSLHALLAKRKITAAAKQLYTRELGSLDANENHLREILRDLTMAATKDGKPISMDPTHDLSQLLSDARGDLREDTARLFRTYDQFTRGRTYVDQLKVDLTARKNWIEKK